MAFDTFLKLTGIEGESTAKGMEKQIEVYSFSWGASNPSTVGSGSGGPPASVASGTGAGWSAARGCWASPAASNGSSGFGFDSSITHAPQLTPSWLSKNLQNRS